MMNYKKDLLKTVFKEIDDIDEDKIIKINNELYNNDLYVDDFVLTNDNIKDFFIDDIDDFNINEFIEIISTYNKNLKYHKYNYNKNIIIPVKNDEINLFIEDLKNTLFNKLDVLNEDYIDDFIEIFEDEIVDITVNKIYNMSNNYLKEIKFNKINYKIIHNLLLKYDSYYDLIVIDKIKRNYKFLNKFNKLKSSSLRSLFYKVKNIFDVDNIDYNEKKYLKQLYEIYFNKDLKLNTLSFINGEIGYNKEIVEIDFFNEIDINIVDFLNMLDNDFDLNNYYYKYDFILIDDEKIINIEDNDVEKIIDDEIDEIIDEIVDNDIVDEFIDYIF